MERKEETVVLCGANSYDEKYSRTRTRGSVNLPKRVQERAEGDVCSVYQ